MENNNKKNNRKPAFITRNETIALFLFTALVFATLYFVQLYITSERIRDVNNYSDNRVGSIIVGYSDITNTSNKLLSKEEFETSLSTVLNNHRLAINEDIKQIIKNSSDVSIFWLSFITVVVLIFSIFTINITRDYADKTRDYTYKFQKRINSNKNFELKFISELVSISNQTRDICKKAIEDIEKKRDSILELDNIEKLKINKEEVEILKKEILADIETTIKKIKEENIFSFDEEITNKYSEILKLLEERENNNKYRG